MRQMRFQMGAAVRMVKALLVSYLLTGLLLLLLAGLLYRFQWDQGKIQIGIIAIYILSCFGGGFLGGKMVASRKFLWGILVGLLYFLILTVVSVAVNRELQTTTSGFITTLILCMGGGMLGGMLS